MGWSAAGGSGRRRDGREPRSFRLPNAVSGGAREAGGRRGASRLSSRLGCVRAGGRALTFPRGGSQPGRRLRPLTAVSTGQTAGAGDPHPSRPRPRAGGRQSPAPGPLGSPAVRQAGPPASSPSQRGRVRPPTLPAGSQTISPPKKSGTPFLLENPRQPVCFALPAV